MNILICDDEDDAALRLKKIVLLSAPDAYIKVFNTGMDALLCFRSGMMPDLCFLDIIMPEIDGILLAGKMREEGYKGAIVFLTTTNDYAAQSYEVGASSYLLKPPKEKDVTALLRKLEEEQKAADNDGIPVKTKNVTMFLSHKNISYVEVVNHKVFFRLVNGGEIEVNARLSEITPLLLADSRFAQCHASFVVNMDDIYQIQGNYILMNRGIKIPISKTFSDFKKLYVKRLF